MESKNVSRPAVLRAGGFAGPDAEVAGCLRTWVCRERNSPLESQAPGEVFGWNVGKCGDGAAAFDDATGEASGA